jgi:hypothetical protein
VRSVRIEFSPDALAQIRAVHDWWQIHRPAAPELLREELAAALEKQVHRLFQRAIAQGAPAVTSARARDNMLTNDETT